MKVFVTGGSGLLGRHLVSMLRKRHEVVHFDCADPGDGLPWVQGDLRDSDAVAKACAGVDAIMHLAALHGGAWANAGDDVGFETNIVGTKNILEAARKNDVKSVIFTSSIWATGHPPNPTPYLPIDEGLPREPQELYGLTKKLGEQMCKYYSSRWGFSTICLRPGGIQPANTPFAGRLGLLFASVDVRDVAQAHALALEASPKLLHEVMIITADTPLCRIESGRFFDDPGSTLESLIPGINRALSEYNLPIPHQAEWFTIEKAKKILGYNPVYNFQLGLLQQG